MSTQENETPPHHTTPEGTEPTQARRSRTASTSTRAAGPNPYSHAPQGPGHGTRSPADRNGLAVAAMVLGVIGWITSIVFIGGPLGVIGLILGVAALRKSKRTGTGRGMAVTGLVTSSLAIVVSILVAVFMTWYANETQECYDPGSFRQYRQCVHDQLTAH
ncbi:DUF4190 domain-containing protein [Streptomyces lavendulae]|uniref:DUF4190 domain-containing protein n=1 Tax=Streptomyces lavendulae TaxID=1914 RepID=UPI003676C193